MGIVKDLSIGKKISIAFAVVIILGLASQVIKEVAINNFKNSLENEVMKSKEALDLIYVARSAVQDMNTEARIYADTGDKAHRNAKLEADELAVGNFAEAKKILEALPHNEAILSKMEEISKADEEGCAPLETKILALIDAGKSEEARRVINAELLPAGTKVKTLTNEFAQMVSEYAAKIQKEAMQMLQSVTILGWIIQVLVTAIGIAVAFFLSRSISSPVTKLAQALSDLTSGPIAQLRSSLDALAAGRLDQKVQFNVTPIKVDSNDEIGQMSKTYNSMLNDLHVAGAAFSKAQLNLCILMSKVADRSSEVRNGSLELGASSSGSSGNSFGVIVDEIMSASDNMSKASDELAISAQKAAEQMHSLNMLIDTVRSSSSDAQTAAKGAGDAARTGGEALSKTLTSMDRIKNQVETSSIAIQELGQKQAQIGAIVQTIEDIADQTNLLALNAAIEAARAGELGRGFAVVADEVRKLAERSSQSTKEITILIDAIRQSVQESVTAMDASTKEVQAGAQVSSEAGQALTKIIDSVSMVETLAEKSLKSVNEMTEAAEGVSDSISNVASVSEETSASAASLSEQSNQLRVLNGLAGQLGNVSGELDGLIGQFEFDRSSVRDAA